MLTAGIIKEVLPDKGKVRVTLPDQDDTETYELPVLQRNTRGSLHYHMPSVGEQVYVLTDDNAEDGCVLGSIYSAADPPPFADDNHYGMVWEDKTAIEYDRKDHLMTVKFADNTELSYDAEHHALKIKVATNGSVEIEAEGPVSVSSAKSMIFKAAHNIALEAPQIALNTSSLSCAAPSSASAEKLKAVFQGDFKIYGDDFILKSANAEIMAPLIVNSAGMYVTGDVYADGSIVDSSGNTNHHTHPEYMLK